MRRFILLAILLITVIATQAQVLNKAQINLKDGATYCLYTGATVDTLSDNQDSIQFTVLAPNNWTSKVYLGSVFAKRSGSDTLVNVNIYGKNFPDEDWTIFATGKTANITTSSVFKLVNYGTAVMYRYFKIVYSIAGTKSTGVKITKWELKLYNQ